MNRIIFFILLTSCAKDTTVRNSYIDLRFSHSEMSATNTTIDPVFVFVILEEKTTATIPPPHIYKQKSFTLEVNNTKKFKFNNEVKLKYLRTCLILKNKLKYCRSEEL